MHLQAAPLAVQRLCDARAPVWLPGGHLQTIYPSLFGHRYLSKQTLVYRRTRLETPDGDFVDIDWVDAQSVADASNASTKTLVLFHGLEGSSRSHYARAFAAWFSAAGWQVALPNFRGCSGETNRLARAYHSGDSAEVHWLLHRINDLSGATTMAAVGVSLGGNALLKNLGECGAGLAELPLSLVGCAAISAPIDLTACGHALGRGLNRIYSQHFLKTLKPKALLKAAHFPDQFDAGAIRRATTLYAYDNAYTAPAHGYRNTDEYWHKASSWPWLRHIAVPTLVVNALNDPFIPSSQWVSEGEVSRFVTICRPAHGGHVGFAQGSFPGKLELLPRSIYIWLKAQLHSVAK